MILAFPQLVFTVHQFVIYANNCQYSVNTISMETTICINITVTNVKFAKSWEVKPDFQLHAT